MDRKYDQELNNFTARFAHYDNYVNEATEANLTGEWRDH